MTSPEDYAQWAAEDPQGYAAYSAACSAEADAEIKLLLADQAALVEFLQARAVRILWLWSGFHVWSPVGAGQRRRCDPPQTGPPDPLERHSRSSPPHPEPLPSPPLDRRRVYPCPKADAPVSRRSLPAT